MPTDLSVLKIDESSRTGRGQRKWLLWVVIIILAAAGAAAAAYGLRSKTPPIETATAHSAASGPSAAAILLNASGYVTPRRRATVAAKITARVEQMYAEEGMHVKTNQVLAILDRSDSQVRLNSAVADRDSAQATLKDLQVNLANAETELRRSDDLYKSGVTTQQSLDTARTAVQSYRARIAQTEVSVEAYAAKIAVAKQDLENCIVRSPYDGIVVSKDAQRGEIVSPSSAGGGFTRTGIATVVDMNSLEVEVDVNESYIARVKENQPVDSILDAYPDWKIRSHVRTIIPTADRQKATVKVRISFDHLDPRILPDMGVKVGFLEEAKPQPAGAVSALVIPRSAVGDDSGSSVVFVYRNGKAERTAVRLGSLNGDNQQIIAGLHDGDQVILNPAGLHDGDNVHTKD